MGFVGVLAVFLGMLVFKVFLSTANLWCSYGMNKSALLLHRRLQFCFTASD